jgi:predicted Zn-dependent protease with MMP-like domain
MAHHVSREKFAQLVERAIARLPRPFADALEDEVRIEIRERPTRQQLRSLEMDDDELLLGLYEGRPLTERSIETSGAMPDVIFIFQEDCELVSDSEQQLVEEVRTTVLHELGHHFGLDEDQLDELGYG